jgi:tetratricopeptide (TPR) repeat protein
LQQSEFFTLELGPRDDERWASVEAEEREYLLFLLDLSLHILHARPRQPETLHAAATALTTLGYYEDGLRYDRALARLRPEDALALYNLACSLALTGATEEAFATLERAVGAGYHDAAHMRRDPDLEALRHFPRFRTLLVRLAGEGETGCA